MSEVTDSCGWLSVDLDEPPQDEMVLIYDWQNDETSTAVYLREGSFVGVRADNEDIKIYHYDEGSILEWQPLPLKPKGYGDISIMH